MVSEKKFTEGIKHCPLETCFEHMGKKWSIIIIRDLFRGVRRYGEFLEKNPKLSAKMLSKRLKELEQDGLIEKKIISTTPLKAEYSLTKKGKDLDKVLYEMVMFSMKNYSKEVFKASSRKFDEKLCSKIIKKGLSNIS